MVCLCLAAPMFAQDMEPRRWTHLPVGTNAADLTYVYTTGDIHVEPALQIEDAELDLHSGTPAYHRYFGLGDMTARADVQLPIQSGRWHGLLAGVPRTVTRDGLGDPRVRLSLNFAGAPALEAEPFQEYIRNHDVRTTAGVGLAVRLPFGEYDDDKLINLGDHRFEFQTQMGVVHTRGPWSFELTGSLFLFTENDDFFNGNRLEKDPLYAIQGHVVRTFDGGFWVSAGASYGWGGETEINGVGNDDIRSNLLYGVLAGFSIFSLQGFRAGYIRQEALNNVGADVHNLVVGWGTRF
ncbi:MAG: transporter [Planctomycetota bacterium]|nr:MAG: transporter [Planctomycetota bacterium]